VAVFGYVDLGHVNDLRQELRRNADDVIHSSDLALRFHLLQNLQIRTRLSFGK
jgi:hypothetical protein